MRRCCLVAALLLGGCHRIFGVTEVADASPDATGIDGPAIDALDAPPCLSTHDEDADGILDDCDNCPEVAQFTNQFGDFDSDGLGDACDPHPGVPGDRRVVFWTFEIEPIGMVRYVDGTTGTWLLENDGLRLMQAQNGNQYFAGWEGQAFDVTVRARLSVSGPPLTTAQDQSSGLWLRTTSSGDPTLPHGIAFPMVRIDNGATVTKQTNLRERRANDVWANGTPDTGMVFALDTPYDFIAHCAGTLCTGNVYSVATTPVLLTTNSFTAVDAIGPGGAGFFVDGASSRFEYLAVYDYSP